LFLCAVGFLLYFDMTFNQVLYLLTFATLHIIYDGSLYIAYNISVPFYMLKELVD